MEENQRNQMREERTRREGADESLNTSSQTGGQQKREGTEQGSGRSYDYEAGEQSGNEGMQGDRENMTQNQGGTTNLGNTGGNSRQGRSMGEGSGLNTKRSVTGSDSDGQNSE